MLWSRGSEALLKLWFSRARLYLRNRFAQELVPEDVPLVQLSNFTPRTAEFAMALHVNLSPQVFGCAIGFETSFVRKYVQIVEQLPSLERSRIVYYLSHVFAA